MTMPSRLNCSVLRAILGTLFIGQNRPHPYSNVGIEIGGAKMGMGSDGPVGPKEGSNQNENVDDNIGGIYLVASLVGMAILACVVIWAQMEWSNEDGSNPDTAMRVTIREWWWSWGLYLLGGAIGLRLWFIGWQLGDIHNVLIEISAKLPEQSTSTPDKIPPPLPADGQRTELTGQ